MFRKFFFNVVSIFFILIIVCILLNWFKYLLGNTTISSLIIQMDNNYYECAKRLYLQKVNVFTKFQDTKDYFVNYVVFRSMLTYFEFLNINIFNVCFLDQVKKGLGDVINRLMHQSHDLNSDLIESTTTVVRLKTSSDNSVYWVIQLGALKNLESVFKIVTKLKMYNYPVYILPEHPICGELVRIFVGPDLSKKQLEYMLNDLYYLSGLHGKVYLYKKN